MGRGSGAVSAAAFVELPAVSLSSGATGSGMELELLDADGSRLTLRLAAGDDLDISGLVAAFRRCSP